MDTHDKKFLKDSVPKWLVIGGLTIALICFGYYEFAIKPARVTRIVDLQAAAGEPTTLVPRAGWSYVVVNNTGDFRLSADSKKVCSVATIIVDSGQGHPVVRACWQTNATQFVPGAKYVGEITTNGIILDRVFDGQPLSENRLLPSQTLGKLRVSPTPPPPTVVARVQHEDDFN